MAPKKKNNILSTINFDLKNSEEYDPYDHRNVEHPNTFAGALIHLLKSSLGSGILAIPSAIAAAGIIIGTVGTLLTGVLACHTVYLLISASQKVCKKGRVPSLGFSETAYAVCKFGPKKLHRYANAVTVFVDVALSLTYFSTIAVYVVFVSTSIRDLVNYHHPDMEDWSVYYYMLMLLPPLILFCQIRELKHLVPISFIANTTMIVAFIITLYYMFSGIDDIPIEERKLFTPVSGVPLFFSTVLFAMEGIGTMLPIENSMLKPRFLGWSGALYIGMSVVTVLYTSIGLFGYLRFGDNVNANVVAELPDEDILAQVAKMCIAVAVFFTFMLQFYVPCDITWRKIEPFIPQKYYNLAQVCLRAILVLFVTGIAAAVPKLDAIISLVGAVFFSTLGLFIPASIDIILNLGDDGDFGFLKWKLWKNILIVILALFAVFSGSYYAIKGLIED